LIRKITHITLAFLVLLSSTGLVANMHYCQNELKNFSFFLETDPCPNEMIKVVCPMHTQGNDHEKPVEKKGCCDDETHFVKLPVEQEAQTFQVELLTDFLLTALIPPTSESLGIESDRKFSPYLNYKPPLIICDVQTRLQTFLC